MNNERLNTMRSKIENVGLEDAGVDEGLVAEIIDELIDSRSQIAILTAERDEALGGVKTLTETVNSLNGQNDRLRQELADIARRFAVGRDEVAGLLRWLKNKSDRGLSVTYLLDSNNPESARNASRVIEIVEGKNAD